MVGTVRRGAFICVGILLLGSQARAQLGLPIPGLDPKRAAIDAAAKQLAPYIAEQTPIRLDPVELYPTVDSLPGAAFNPTSDVAAQTKVLASVAAQLQHSSTGSLTLAPGDYAIPVRLFCMSHSRPARAPLAFLLGKMEGKRAPAIVAMNARAASSSYAFPQLQTTSWAIQSGIGLGDFPSAQSSVVNSLIPDYASLLSGSTLQDIENKWNSLAAPIPGAPSLDSAVGQMGAVGRTIVELKEERDQLLAQAADFDALRRTFAPLQAAEGNPLDTPWSAAAANVSMRMLTTGHYGDLGTVQIRVTGQTATVPLTSSIAYGRCTPQITTQGSAYACTQPLSFVPQKQPTPVPQ